MSGPGGDKREINSICKEKVDGAEAMWAPSMGRVSRDIHFLQTSRLRSQALIGWLDSWPLQHAQEADLRLLRTGCVEYNLLKKLFFQTADYLYTK